MYKLDFEKTEGTETKLPMPLDPRKHKEKKKKKDIYYCSIDYAKAFDYVDHNKL